jgi:hypothetical protein
MGHCCIRRSASTPCPKVRRKAPQMLMPLAGRSRVDESRCHTGYTGHFSLVGTYSRLRNPRPKLRDLEWLNCWLSWGFGFRGPVGSDYLRVSGIGVLRISKARRWVSVGMVRVGIRGPVSP